MTFMMFIFAIASLFAIFMWNQFEDSVNSLPNETIKPYVKEQISELGNKVLWADKLFVFTYFCLLVGFLISAVSSPVDRPEYFIIYFIILLVICLVAMFMSNTWNYLLEQPNFLSIADDLKFTTYFMSYYPIFTLLVGFAGGALFYTRRKGTNEGVQGFE